MEIAKCPVCGSGDVRKDNKSLWECDECRSKWVVVPVKEGKILNVTKRICALGELEAKVALFFLIEKIEKSIWCDNCPDGCKTPVTREGCMNKILDEALMHYGLEG